MKKTKYIFHRKGSGEIEAIMILAVLAFIIWVIASLFGFNYHGTSEGTVTYNDCRAVIQIQPDSWQTYFGTFVCNYAKSQSGQIMGGQCVRVVNDSSLFSTSHSCATAYVYNVTSSPVCEGNIKDGVSYPYLGYNDQCYITPQLQTEWVAVPTPQGTFYFPDQAHADAFKNAAGISGMGDSASTTSMGASSTPQGETLMIGPDGKQYNVPNANVQTFIAAGGKKE
jgi:hypothetical protein